MMNELTASYSVGALPITRQFQDTWQGCVHPVKHVAEQTQSELPVHAVQGHPTSGGSDR